MEDKELEKLLPDEEHIRLKRIPSNRFQVSRSEAIDESDPREQQKAESEPPPLTPKETHHVERKTSCSNGRFTIITDNEISQEEEVESHDGSQESLVAPTKAKGVHFSVGDAHEDKGRESADHTTINMKSWRNMKTIEHPPIIDFYRNSIDLESGAVRPSMAQLIHGEKDVPDELALEDFKLQSDELVEGAVQTNSPMMEKFSPPPTQARVKFGWVQGVFVRCLLNIFGVMLYLRISWVAGQAGLGLGSIIVLLASLVTTVTALSTCAICTNGDVKGGGAYFLISRTLGPEYGGSIGLIFCFANAVGGAMYIVGFAETVRDIMKEHDIMIIDGGLWDVRIIGFVTCIFLIGIVFIGTEFESKMQMGLLVILLISLANYALGLMFPPTEEMAVRGVTGFSWNTVRENFMPRFRGGEGFFTVFAVYFPAATGIMAGANISGDLANPQKAIPRGTLLAIAVTTVVYLVTVWLTGSTCVRDADGINPPVWNGTEFVEPACLANTSCTYGLMNYFQVMEMESFWGLLISAGIFAATLSSALASLVSAPKVFQAVCRDNLYPKIDYFAKSYGKNEEPRRAYLLAFFICVVVVGIGDLNAIAPIISNFFLASYALINYACFDQSFADSPGFRPSFKYYNKWLALAGSILCIVVMFIISWSTALITFVCFAVLYMYIHRRKPNVNWGSSTQAHSYKNALAGMIKLSNTEEHVKNFRPQFLVLTGNPAARPSLVDFANSITKGTSLMICGYVVPYQPSDRIASVMRKLDRQLNFWLHKRKVKSFYTSTANPSIRIGVQNLLQASGLGRLRPNIVLIGFKCNWYMGGPTETKLTELNDYFGTIQDAFDMNLGVCILRNSGSMGLDFSEAMKQLNVGESGKLNLPDVSKKSIVHNTSTTSLRRPSSSAPSETVEEGKESGTATQPASLPHKDSARSMEHFAQMNHHFIRATDSLHENNYKFEFNEMDEEAEEEHEDNHLAENEEDEELEEEHATEEGEEDKLPHVSDDDRKNNTFSLRRRKQLKKAKHVSQESGSRRPTMEQRALLTSISRFQKKIVKGVIDVWWLYDDGGLTLLIPHLLTIPKSYLEGAKLRVFTISTSSLTMEQEQRGMAALLSKFRIDFSNVSVIADIGRKPNKELVSQWESVIAPWIAPDENCPAGMTSVSDLAAQKEKTYRQLRTRELLKQHSMNSDLIVLTLPVPRKGKISASLYMSWLDIMTAGMPPILFVRGNQSSVLTFYS